MTFCPSLVDIYTKKYKYKAISFFSCLRTQQQFTTGVWGVESFVYTRGMAMDFLFFLTGCRQQLDTVWGRFVGVPVLKKLETVSKPLLAEYFIKQPAGTW